MEKFEKQAAEVQVEKPERFLDKATILGRQDLVYEMVDVPEWGGQVRVRSLTAKERDHFEAGLVSKDGKTTNMANLRAKLVQLTVVDEAGANLFGVLDIEALGGKNAAAVHRVFDVAQKLAGIGAKAMEEMKEKLENHPSEGSSSD